MSEMALIDHDALLWIALVCIENKAKQTQTNMGIRR
jgi:hypothetical protein